MNIFTVAVFCIEIPESNCVDCVFVVLGSAVFAYYSKRGIWSEKGKEKSSVVK